MMSFILSTLLINSLTVIACDGLKSKTRQILLGADDPASYPQYTHKVAYRTLVPKEKVVEAIGLYKTERLCFQLGKSREFLTFCRLQPDFD